MQYFVHIVHSCTVRHLLSAPMLVQLGKEDVASPGVGGYLTIELDRDGLALDLLHQVMAPLKPHHCLVH